MTTSSQTTNNNININAILSALEGNTMPITEERKRQEKVEKVEIRIRISLFVFFIACIIGMIVMFGFSVDGDVKFADVREISCNATKIEVANQSVLITATFSIVDNIVMTEIIQIDCENNCIIVLEDYEIGQHFICYWYPNSEILAIEGNYVVLSAVLTVFSIIACLCFCGCCAGLLN